MSPAIAHADNRRVTARVVLFIVIAVIMTLVLFSGGPNGSWVSAQQTSPVTSIEWVNPDDGQSTEISAKADGSPGTTANSYHLVAWVALPPSGSTVDFSYRVGSSTPTPICTATAVGNDTYQCDWAGTAMPPDGGYNLVATLSAGGATPAASDTEAVVVNNTADAPPEGLDPTTEQGETVEITDPLNGGSLNFTDPPGTPRFTAIVQVKHSAGATELTPYYTVSAAGSEPAWTACKNGAQTAAEAANGVECELASPTFPTQVTGIAVVASDAPLDPIPEPDIDSGDAHRVTGVGASPSPSGSPSSASPTTASPSSTPTTASPSPSASTPPPPIAYSSRTTIDYNGKAFTGKVRSDARKCRSGRNVVLMKEKAGKDKKVGSDRTNRKGNYSINEPNADGTYYTVAKSKGFTDNAGRSVTCAPDRSKKRKV